MEYQKHQDEDIFVETMKYTEIYSHYTEHVKRERTCLPQMNYRNLIKTMFLETLFKKTHSAQTQQDDKKKYFDIMEPNE